MPNLHVRDVPGETLDVLRSAAERSGRSLDAELVAVLIDTGDLERGRDGVTRELERIRRAWRRRHPDGFPPGRDPETIVRTLRDAG